MPSVSRAPIDPGRIRSIKGEGFSFIPNRFLRDGFLVSLTRDELAMYLLLVLVADRNGVSFYHYDSLCSILELTLEQYLDVRNSLIDIRAGRSREACIFDSSGARVAVTSGDGGDQNHRYHRGPGTRPVISARFFA